ncbi:hypothetical protein KVR01_003053 [Diaporthe batatas]|uniref:uncharacterized protein n=1 Tax=Diaporthe batatas TaxID=748121 RepID=UPI001D0421ED|nr:uncharacterized protein KVR01_003053 [Diaporthe batatas]KAG8167364.1 hypothetical protein KVR01_003053 [Diaporthe batatas]
MSDSGEHEDVGGVDSFDEDLDPTEDLFFPLLEHTNAPAAAEQGQTKSYHVKQDSPELYAHRNSDYSIKVQRLLWIDGQEKAQEWINDPDTKKPIKREVVRDSTLVVLKIQMCSERADQRFKWMKATLSLEDGRRGGENHPEVEAWAPWRELERGNEVVGHHEVAKQVEAGAKLGYQGSDISVGRGRQESISWEKTHFDVGHSSAGSKDGKQNSVTWYTEENDLQNQGIKPEVWVSALFSRSSPAPYLVKFDIYVHAGKLDEFHHKTKRFFGIGPGRTKAFFVTPGKQQIIKGEGVDMMDGIDVGDFGKLRDKALNTSLHVTWGLTAHNKNSHTLAADIGAMETPKAAYFAKGPGKEAKEGAEKPPEQVKAAEEEGKEWIKKAIPSGFHESSPSMSCRRPSAQTWPALTTAGITEYTRLVAVEGRVADTEARIAAQDKFILQLQRELMSKDVQLAKMEQAIQQLATLRSGPA